jgi:S-adenosylmethionine-diacylglycerol 3-amino-3-carboxypropyl transferase
MNQSQLHLCALKKAAFSTLTHEQLLDFLGFSYSKQRKELYELIKHELSDEAQIYWDARLAVIVNGLIYSGKFEQYFKLFREKVLPWIHNDKKIIRLLFPKNAFQQECYYFDVWNSWRWRFLFKIFFSKTVMGRFGRTKEYLNQVEVPVGEFIFKQAEQHLIDDACQENYFLHFIFLGDG